MKKYRANKYDVLKFNCNHFSNEFLMHLTGRGIPNYLNRLAYLGSFFHCMVPKRYLEVTPDPTYYDQISKESSMDSENEDDMEFD